MIASPRFIDNGLAKHDRVNQRMCISRTSFVAASVAIALALVAFDAAAAPPWVDRHLTPPAGDWAFDAAAGVAHAHRDPAWDGAAPGINLEMAVGVTDRVALWARTGMRFGDDRDRSVVADEFARLFDRQSLVLGPGALGNEVFANPEVGVRGALVRDRVVEVGLEGRVVLPFAFATDAGLLFGVPFAIHLGDRVRLDFGAYVPVVFQHPTTYVGVSLPLDVWIQASPRVWLGPMTGLFVQQPGDATSQTFVSFGFGFGYQITHYLDFKAMLLFPTINTDSRFFGGGAGIQIRIE